jgi:hypothetical protein
VTDPRSRLLAGTVEDGFGVTDLRSRLLAGTVGDGFGVTDDRSRLLAGTVGDGFGVTDDRSRILFDVAGHGGLQRRRRGRGVGGQRKSERWSQSRWAGQFQKTQNNDKHGDTHTHEHTTAL